MNYEHVNDVPEGKGFLSLHVALRESCSVHSWLWWAFVMDNMGGGALRLVPMQTKRYPQGGQVRAFQQCWPLGFSLYQLRNLDLPTKSPW